MNAGIEALWMRGGTSKGLFLRAADVPADPAARNLLLARLLGSPDPYKAQIDGLGGATSSTSKVVLLARSARADADIDYLFGQVSVDTGHIDWSGNCGNLSAAVGPAAFHLGLVPVPAGDHATVRIWQMNIGKHIVARVPLAQRQVQEQGAFMLDGVAFPAAPIELTFLDPAPDEEGGIGGLFPTGRLIDQLEPTVGAPIEATLITAGNPTVIVRAADLGLGGDELQPRINGDADLLARLEAIRAAGSVAMGLADSLDAATHSRPATPKIAFIAPPARYVSAASKAIEATEIDLLARILSMGKLHHAFTGTGSVALAAASAVPGTIASEIAGQRSHLRIGHTSGVLDVGAKAEQRADGWTVTEATMTRSARRLMQGRVFA
ncbi:3-methylitaconate isomerase [beta proteobacterium AAP99]|nr:3-methylitaconate isomerase [beta proteobacterium AAP99]